MNWGSAPNLTVAYIYFSSVLVQPPTIVCKLVEIHPANSKILFFTMDIFRFFPGDFHIGATRGEVSEEVTTQVPWWVHGVFLKACHFLLKGMRSFDGEATVEHCVYHVNL